MNLYITIENLRPKNYVTGFKVAATDEIHEMIAERLAETVGDSLTNIVESLRNENFKWDQSDFSITIRSDDGAPGYRERITKHVVDQK